MIEKAILRDGKIVQCDDLLEWAREFENHRIIQKSIVQEKEVSTIFLGINHGSEKHPQWFETMIFPDHELINRYATLEEAILGHAQAVKKLKNSLP